MSIPTQTQVLIVGAGPNGLACAISLTTLGIQVTIVEASPTNKNGSRAAVVHAHTLEMLDTIGLAKPIMEAGVHSNGAIIHGGSEKLLQVDVTQLDKDTAFPVAVLIPQHELEIIFRTRLAAEGIKLLYNRRAIGLKEGPAGGEIQVYFDDGSVINAQYVVGADGSHSTIREAAGIEFGDPDAQVARSAAPVSAPQLVLADVYLEEPLPNSIPRDALSFHFNNFLFLTHLYSEVYSSSGKGPSSFWRIAMVIPSSSPAPPSIPDVHYLQRELDARNPWHVPVSIKSVITASRYKVRFAVASTFYKKLGTGHILLLGDAAHVHSPIGGQGMNLGLCDAIALSKALHVHMNASSGSDSTPSPDTVLHKYAESRKKTAIKVIGMTRQMSAVGIFMTGWRIYVRNIALWIAGNIPAIRRAIAWRISGLSNRGA